jgi:hypothetical protein
MKKQKPYQEMTTAELRAATREFDEDFVADRARPMNKAERARWRQLRRPGRGRPRIGAGAQKINVCLERGLLAEVKAVGQETRHQTLGIDRPVPEIHLGPSQGGIKHA